jgi:hypothetical protein
MFAGLAIEGEEELAQDLDPGQSEFAGGVEADVGREGVECALEAVAGVGEGVEAGVGAELGGGAEDADGAELLQDIGVAEQGGFEAGGLVVGLMLADAGEDGGEFFSGAAEAGQEGGALSQV